MRLQTLLGWVLALILPTFLWATAYNEMEVVSLQGTIMVQHPNNLPPTALMTGSTVEKGDILTCYDQSWVILKTHSGARIGLDGVSGPTVVSIDEFYLEGPDRQIRLILQKGALFLKTNGYGSRQSFFEINTGSVVTSINDTQALLTYDPDQNLLSVQHMTGDLTVIDKDHEEKFKYAHSERHWNNGVMTEKEAVPLDELDVINYNRFFDCQDLLAEVENNILLSGQNILMKRKSNLYGINLNADYNLSAADMGAGGTNVQEANKDYHAGLEAYRNRDFGASKNLWELALNLAPGFSKAQAALNQLKSEKPELFKENSSGNNQALDEYNKGRESYQKGDFPSAKKHWNLAIALKPGYPEATDSLSKLQTEHPELK